jgi:hypothetical protein
MALWRFHGVRYPMTLEHEFSILQFVLGILLMNERAQWVLRPDSSHSLISS